MYMANDFFFFNFNLFWLLLEEVYSSVLPWKFLRVGSGIQNDFRQTSGSECGP